MNIKISENPNAFLQQCFNYQKNGEFEKAIEGFKKLLNIYPNNPQLLGSLGMAFLQNNQFKDGCRSLEKSLKIDPNQPTTRLNLALGYEQQNRLQEALSEFDKAIKLQPSSNEVYFRKAKLLMKLQQFEAAIEVWGQIAAVNLTSSDSLLNKGICLHHLNKDLDAVDVYNHALRHDRENPALFNARGISELSLNRFDDAIISFEESIKINVSNPQAWNNHGLALHRLSKLEEAVNSFNQALKINPDYADAYSNRGLSQQALKDHEKALKDFNSAIMIDVQHPDAHWNKSILKLQMGEFEEGWQLYEWRWKSFSKQWARNYKQPLWLGQFPLKNKTILIYPEQGYGDFIQFSRYIPLLKEQAAKVIVEVPSPLVQLAYSLDADIKVIETGGLFPSFDYQCPIMSLPLAFKTTLENIPNSFPYIKAEADKLEFWGKELGKRNMPRIGLAWSGSTHHKNDHNRSLEFKNLLPLFELPFEFHSLQTEIREIDKAVVSKTSIRVHQQDLKDFSDTAALIEMMDLIITVDTAVAHLAGALNKRVILLLPENADYRWLINSSSSPWYPNTEIYRQIKNGDWPELLNRVKKNLSGQN